MFHFHDADDFERKTRLQSQIDPESETWLVADLHAKNRLQTQILKTHKCLPEDAVLRASELWRKILNRGFVDIDVASAPFISTLIGEWLKKRDIPWARHPGTPRLLMQYIGEFLPVLTKQENSLRMVEWLREHPEAFMRWGNWFVLAHEAWQYFCTEKVLAATWVSAYLAGQDWSAELWGRRLVVDAGSNLTGVEVDLLQRLSRDLEIHVFAPSEEWSLAYAGTLWPYDVLVGRSPVDKKIKPAKVSPQLSCSRFTTCIAEVKAATAKIREWLEAGLAPHEIGVVAADIETYWPSLSAYLQKEGVPAAKDVVVSAASFPSVARWFARLKIESRDIESGHLEMSVFHPQMKAPISFDRFQQLFNRIYDENDLGRDAVVQKIFDFEAAPTDRLARDRFFLWALKYWVDEPAALERIAAEFLQECPADTVLELRSWISYLSALTAKIEIKTAEATVGGVFCGNLESAQGLELKNIIILGMSEEELRPAVDLNIAQADILQLSRDLGILLNSPDRDENEFLAARLTAYTRGEVQLYFATSNFSGQAQAPSLFWLQKALAQNPEANIEECQSPPPTRWDELQLVAPDAESARGLAMHRDLGLRSPEVVPLKKSPTYSPSQIEKYLACPFLFTADKLFHLSDLPDVDLDVDAMTSGRVIHGLVERLLEPPVHWDLEESEMSRLVDDIRREQAFALADERLWPAKRRLFVKMGMGFLAYEREWRARFPRTETVARELKVKGEWEVAPGRHLKITGRVDRIDQMRIEGDPRPKYVVLDYKSSAGGLRGWGSWLDNDELQLAFYTLALQEGYTELPAGDVIGAFYYVMKNIDREKGFRVKDAVGPLFDENNRNKSALSGEDLAALLEKVRARVAEVAAKIESGHFSPEPKEIKECDQCKWSTLCRAPHLN